MKKLYNFLRWASETDRRWMIFSICVILGSTMVGWGIAELILILL